MSNLWMSNDFPYIPYPSNVPCCALPFLFQSRSSACISFGIEIYTFLYLPSDYTPIQSTKTIQWTRIIAKETERICFYCKQTDVKQEKFSVGGSREYDISLHEAQSVKCSSPKQRVLVSNSCLLCQVNAPPAQEIHIAVC